ncbi:MAG: hypothetical protein R3F61_18530 [Myxococcota bacterium]
MLALLTAALAAPSAPAGPPDAELHRLAEVAWRHARLGRSDAPVEVHTDVVRWPAGARVRVTPVVDGLVVDRASSVVALDPSGALRRVTGPPVRFAAPARGTLGPDEAIAALEPLRSGLGAGELWSPRAEERWLALPEGTDPASPAELRHTWHIAFSTADPPATWESWVDATTGAVLLTDTTSATVDGRVFPVSPFHGPPETLPLEHLTSSVELRGTYSDAYSCAEWEISDQLFATNRCEAVTRYALAVDGQFVSTPHPGVPVDPFAEVNLYHHVSRVAAFFDERYGLRPPAPIRTIANFPLANAFYGDFDGDGVGDLSFGFTEDVQFAYDGDVVYHEFGHWVVGRIANIPSLGADDVGLLWTGGSLNEGAADVFSMLLTLDPDLGEYTGRAFSDGPIRALEDDRTCPQGLLGEVHRDGEMFASLGWNLIDAVGWEVASDVVFGAVASWGPDISWRKAGQSLLDSAADLEAAGVIDADVHGRIADLVVASGMPDCGRIIPLAPDEPVDAFVLSAGLEGDFFRIPGGAQLAIDVPADADRLIVDVTAFSADEGLAWSLYLRRDEPVRMIPTELAAFGLGLARADEWDWLVDGEGTARLAFDATSTPPLVPGSTYYIAVAGRDAGPLELFEFTLGRMTLSAAPFTFEDPRGCATGVRRPAAEAAEPAGPSFLAGAARAWSRRRIPPLDLANGRDARP